MYYDNKYVVCWEWQRWVILALTKVTGWGPGGTNNLTGNCNSMWEVLWGGKYRRLCTARRLAQSWKVREGCSEEGAAELGPEGWDKGSQGEREETYLPWVVPLLHTHVHTYTYTLLYFHIWTLIYLDEEIIFNLHRHSSECLGSCRHGSFCSLIEYIQCNRLEMFCTWEGTGKDRGMWGHVGLAQIPLWAFGDFYGCKNFPNYLQDRGFIIKPLQ